MTDNIFDRLAELLQSDGPVNWRLASQIAESVAGTAEPLDPWVAEEYEELGRTAALLLGRAGTVDPNPLPPLEVADPRGWAAADIEGFSYVAEPLAEKTAGGGGGHAMGLEQIFGQLAPALVGLQVGGLVGGWARTLMGPFDAPLPPCRRVATPYLVVPNVEAFAASAGIDVRQVRLWAVLRETAHEALMTVPWVRGHLASLAADYLGGLQLHPDQLQERLQGLQDPAELERMLSEPGGLTGFAAGPELEAVREELTAMLALLDGAGRTVVEQAAEGLLPDLKRISEAADHRHEEPGPDTILEQMFGLEVDSSLAETAAGFCLEIGRRWGSDAGDRLWANPEALPTVSELGDPVGWAARVLLPDDL